MKTLDLKKLNVVELNELQKQSLDGGCWFCVGVDVVATGIKGILHKK